MFTYFALQCLILCLPTEDRTNLPCDLFSRCSHYVIASSGLVVEGKGVGEEVVWGVRVSSEYHQGKNTLTCKHF